MKRLIHILQGTYDNINTLDGIKIQFNSVEWVLIRPSNTQPAINLSIEGRNSKRIHYLETKFSKILENTKNEFIQSEK